ncbi:LapA family protein [Verrucomicrobiota bacterium]
MQMQLIVTLLIALVLIVLTIQNPNPVPVQFMSWGVTQGIPLIIIILVSSLVGVIASSLLGLKKQLGLRKRIRQLQMELDEVRQPPVTADDDILGDPLASSPQR